jgi:hypothetical protein
VEIQYSDDHKRNLSSCSGTIFCSISMSFIVKPSNFSWERLLLENLEDGPLYIFMVSDSSYSSFSSWIDSFSIGFVILPFLDSKSILEIT